ncbi:hypothetical protein [Microbacterium sp. Root61]|uniref:hypothetical protein n=1 Tax=Microbacterium sp. Root61 TaxID=1736570 RepID=UPI0006FED3E4|nr:hypothetical protein [Microbacterium sp. Root61]
MTFAANWTPSDHFGMWQLIVAILGFGLAFWQLVRTANATVASNKALQRRLLHNDLLVMLPEVHALEDAVDRAARVGERDDVSMALVSYSRRVTSMVGALKSDAALKDHKVTKALAAAAKAAGELKATLYDVEKPDVRALVRPVQVKIQTASRETGEVLAALQRSGESTDGKKRGRAVR